MDERFRILRVVMASAGLLLVVKVVGLATGTDIGLVGMLTGAKDAHAGEKSHTSATPPESAAAPSAPAAHDAVPEGDKGAEAAKADAAPTVPAKDSKSEEPRTSQAAAAQGARDGQTLSRAEIDVLENLSHRRVELDQRARDLDLKEKLLIASEQRIEERVKELKSIEANIQTLIGTRDAAQDAQLASLVKVYETMKPKDAARIFEQLEMDILLPVAQHMKSAKFAPILAEMDSSAAKRLTVALATRLDVPPPDAAEAPLPAAVPQGG